MSATAKTMVYFELKCDGCGRVHEDEECRLYAEASEVRDVASGEDWRRQPDGRDLCAECAWTNAAIEERVAVEDA